MEVRLKINPNSIYEFLPLKITIDIPIIVSYMIELQRLKSVGLVKKTLDLQLWALKLGSNFLD